MALTNKTVAGSYKDLLELDNSNNGVPTNPTILKDGEGTSSALYVGQRGVKVKPSSDSVRPFEVENTAGTNVLTVDTTNKLVKVNETQAVANTQYLRFGYNDIDVDNGTHIGVPIMGAITNANVTFGTSGDPAAPAVSNNGDDWVHYLHYVDTDITVDAVSVLVGASGSSGDSINFHLCSLATTDTTTVDEWSSTTIVADQSSVTVNNGYEQFYRIALDIQSANVDAGNYLALTIEGNGTSSDYSVNALVRYHLR
jgi:hypothetical protein